VKLSLHLLWVEILKQVRLELKGRKGFEMMIGLVNFLIVESVKAANFGTNRIEDVAAANISV